MRVKDFWEIVPLPAKIKLFWDRITLTRTTTIYFTFSVLHCVVQVIFQAQALHLNVQAADFLASITKQGNATKSHAFYVFGNDLRLCDHAPSSLDTSFCQVIWDGILGNNTFVQTPIVMTPSENTTADPSPWTKTNGTAPSYTTSAQPSTYFHRSSRFTPTAAEAENRSNQDDRVSNENVVVKRTFPGASYALSEINRTMQVVVDGLGWNEQGVILEGECLWALGWPTQVLRNTKREDLTFIMFQIWVLGMSIVAILNESVPHIIATLLTHLVANGWAGFQIFNTFHFHSNFAKVTTNGACHPINLLPNYWQSRSAAEITSLALNAVALLVSAFLSWKLTKLFGWQTFKRVGPSLTISRIYKIVLILSIVIQLSLFFIVTSIALWLDQLWNGAIGRLASSPLYRPCLTVTLILLPLWLAFGWYSVRRERKAETLIFLFMCLGYLAGWGAMFDSTTFRWTYMTWAFFGVMTTASVFLTVLSFMLGIICRLNFGKGLLNYLKAQEPIEEGFDPVIVGDPEKMAFPSNKEPTFPIPIRSSRIQVLPPPTSSQNATLQFAQPMILVGQSSLQQPSPAITRTPSERAWTPVHQELSQSSIDTSMSCSSERTNSKHWIVE